MAVAIQNTRILSRTIKTVNLPTIGRPNYLFDTGQKISYSWGHLIFQWNSWESLLRLWLKINCPGWSGSIWERLKLPLAWLAPTTILSKKCISGRAQLKGRRQWWNGLPPV